MIDKQIMPDDYDEWDGEEIILEGGWKCKLISLGSGYLYYPMPPLTKEEKNDVSSLRKLTGYKEEKND